MKVRLLLAFACALGTIMVRTCRLPGASAVEPVVVVNTDKPKSDPLPPQRTWRGSCSRPTSTRTFGLKRSGTTRRSV